MPVPTAATPPIPLDLDRDEVDPELVALPDPPRGERRSTLVLLGVTALASLAMVAALARDASYALSPAEAADLGDLHASPAESFQPNRHVRAHGMLGAAGAIRYERPLESDSYRLMPVAGRQDVWVEVRVPAGQETARWVPPSEFSGRLIPLSKTGPRHRGLSGAVQDATGRPIGDGAWLLVDGERPEGSRWALALVALFSAFAVWNLAAIRRLTRKVR